VRYKVLHMSIPLGSVELPDGRLWAGGLLEAESSYEPLRETLVELTRVAGRDVIGSIMHLPAGERPRTDRLSNDAREAVLRAAAMDFELRTESGTPAPVDVVRVIDLGDGRPARVAAQFRVATAGSPAWLPDWQRDGQNDGDAGV
jgi:hypothetical protein